MKKRKSLFTYPLWMAFYLLWWVYHLYLLSKNPPETPKQLIGLVASIAVIPIILTIALEIIIFLLRFINFVSKWIVNKFKK